MECQSVKQGVREGNDGNQRRAQAGNDGNKKSETAARVSR